MREIKFRAWRTKQRNMDYSDSWNWLGAFLEFHERTYANGYELMQYTGLTDRNGKEIYEYDLWQLRPNGRAYIVSWNKTGWWLLNSRSNEWWTVADGLEFGEVIGDTYSNPELLERNESA